MKRGGTVYILTNVLQSAFKYCGMRKADGEV